MDASQMTPEMIAALRQQVAAGASPYGGPPAPGPASAPAPQGRIPGLSPEALQQLMALGALDEKGSALDEQMAMAQALRAGTGRQYRTGIGGALGAVGDALNTYHAKGMMDDVKAGRESIAQERTAGRQQLAKLMGF